MVFPMRVIFIIRTIIQIADPTIRTERLQMRVRTLPHAIEARQQLPSFGSIVRHALDTVQILETCDSTESLRSSPAVQREVDGHVHERALGRTLAPVICEDVKRLAGGVVIYLEVGAPPIVDGELGVDPLFGSGVVIPFANVSDGQYGAFSIRRPLAMSEGETIIRGYVRLVNVECTEQEITVLGRNRRLFDQIVYRNRGHGFGGAHARRRSRSHCRSFGLLGVCRQRRQHRETSHQCGQPTNSSGGGCVLKLMIDSLFFSLFALAYCRKRSRSRCRTAGRSLRS